MIYNKIKSYRVGLDLTQQEIAKMLSISTNAYNKKESGKNEFTQSEMFKLLDIFKKVDDSLTIEKLFT